MKKISLLIIVCIYSINIEAQFFRGIGFFGAVNHSNHHYKNKEQDQRDFSFAQYTVNPQYYYPQSHVSREHFSWGAGLFLELLNNEGMRWQTEFEYTKKGAKEKEIIDRYYGIRDDKYGVNKYSFIQWNNYLKFFLRGNMYWMAGVRLEYNLSRSTPVFSEVSGNLKRIWFGGDLAIGKEFNTRSIFKPFVEYHWNPDIIRQKPVSYASVWRRTFELRAGVIIRKKKRSIDDCNAPKYHGNYY